MTTNIVILGIKDIMKIYGFSWHYAYGLIKRKGCPVLPRKRNEKIRVIQSEFEEWMKAH